MRLGFRNVTPRPPIIKQRHPYSTDEIERLREILHKQKTITAHKKKIMINGIQESKLMRAVKDADIEKVAQILDTCKSKDDIDGKGKSFCTRVGTTMMAAARGNGTGGDVFHTILKDIWRSYTRVTCGILQGRQMRNILLETDTRHQWNVLMHSAKCGDEKNLTLVLGFYTEIFGDVRLITEIRDSIDLVHVDHKVKDLINTEIFSGSVTPIFNYGTVRAKRSCTIKRQKSLEVLNIIEIDGTKPNKEGKNDAVKKHQTASVKLIDEITMLKKEQNGAVETHQTASIKLIDEISKLKKGKNDAVKKHQTASVKLIDEHTKSKTGKHTAMDKHKTVPVKLRSSRQSFSLRMQKLKRTRIELPNEDNLNAKMIKGFFLAGTDIESSEGETDDCGSSSSLSCKSESSEGVTDYCSSSSLSCRSDDDYLPSAHTKNIAAELDRKEGSVSKGARHRKKTQAKKRALEESDDLLSKLRSERDSALAREEAALKENKKLKAALRQFLI